MLSHHLDFRERFRTEMLLMELLFSNEALRAANKS